MKIAPQRLNHMNLVVEGFDDSLRHFQELYGAEFLKDLPSPEFHAALIALGGGLFEIFAPNAYLLNARHGPFYLGVEYQADMDQVREAVASRGIRIVRDIGVAIHTHPADTLGVSFEFYGQHFTDTRWPRLGRAMLPQAYWRDEHPLGMTGLRGYSIAVHDLDAAVSWLCGFLQAEALREDERPGIGGHAVVLQVADAEIELVAPAGEGDLSAFLARYGQGVMSTVFGVSRLDAVRTFFGRRGIALRPGSTSRRLAIAAAANAGALFEFEEGA